MKKGLLLLSALFLTAYEAKGQKHLHKSHKQNTQNDLRADIEALKKEIANLKNQQKDTAQSLVTLDPQNDQQLAEKSTSKDNKITMKDKLHIHGQMKMVALHDMSEIGENYNRDYSYAVQLLYREDPKAQYGNETRMHAKESKLVFTYNDTIRMFGEDMPVSTFLDIDFYNGKEGNGLFTHSHQPRIRSGYIDIGNLRVGLGWTLFMDLENFPQAIDFGNSTGEALLRQPQIQYTYHYNKNWSFAAAIENPDSAYVRLNGTKTYTYTLGGSGSKESRSSVPDLIVAMRYKNEKINTGLRGVVTHARTYETGKKLEKYGAGFGWSGGYTFDNKDRIIAHFNFGDGMGRYLHDTADSGFFLDTNDKKLYRHKVFGVVACYKHHWKPELVSNINFGLTKIKLHDHILNQDDPVPPTGGDLSDEDKNRAFKFFDKLITVHANLIWNPASNVELGLEYLHIHKFKAKFTKLTEVPSRNAYTNRLIASLKITF